MQLPNPQFLLRLVVTGCVCSLLQLSPVHAEEQAAAGAASDDGAGPLSFFTRFFTTPVAQEPTSEPKLSDDTLEVQELVTFPSIRKTIDLTDSPDDLWVRIRNGFAMPDLNDSLVLHYQQWYLNRPDALRRMVERSRPYMHHIVEEIEARGMPTELALLPMVESSFNPMAYSRAHASGLWQFIPATGKRFKLEQNWWQDQRRDIVASTGAALEYLQTIYEMNGDWHLALASYNWGEGAVKRAIEKNAARGLATDYSSLIMPTETRHYVPKLQALKNIFGNPVLMLQLRLPEINNRPYFGLVETGKLVDVKTAAKLANMPVQEFVALNPSHNRPVIQGYTPMVIPADKLETFQNNLQNNNGPLSAWQSYTLKPGDKLNKLAPRFGITMADLMRVNGLPAKAKTTPGMTLLVPSGQGTPDLDNLPDLPTPAASAPESSKLANGKSDNKPVAAAVKEFVSKSNKQPQPAGKTSGKSASGKGAPKNAVIAKGKPVAGKAAHGKAETRPAAKSTSAKPAPAKAAPAKAASKPAAGKAPTAAPNAKKDKHEKK